VIFIIKAKAMDKFNLQGYLKNNQLKPVKEEIGTAMGEDEDYEGPSIDGLISQKYLAVFVEAVEIMIDDLVREGFEPEDVKSYLINKINEMHVEIDTM
jgi:hypothetical protein